MTPRTRFLRSIGLVSLMLALTGCVDVLTGAAIQVGGSLLVAGIDAATSESGSSTKIVGYCWNPEKQTAVTSTTRSCTAPSFPISEEEYDRFHDDGVAPRAATQHVSASKAPAQKLYCLDAKTNNYYILTYALNCMVGDQSLAESEWRRKKEAGNPSISAESAAPSQQAAYCWDPERQIAYRRPGTACIGTDRKVTEAQFPELEAREEARRAAAQYQKAPASVPPAQQDAKSSPSAAVPAANPSGAQKPAAQETLTAALEKPQELDLSRLEYRGNGSGFFVSKEGHVLTNNHVVEGCPILGAINSDGIYQAKVIATDAEVDLALIQSEYRQSEQAAFANRLPEAGDDVYAIGFPLFDEFFEIKITDGIVSGVSGFDGDRRFIQMTTPIQPGNSGGPLVDAAGLIVGVIESKRKGEVAEGLVAEGIGFAVAPQVAAKFIEANGLKPRIIASEKERKVRDIMRDAKRWTVLIACFSEKV